MVDKNTICNKNDFSVIEDISICVICEGVVMDPVQCNKCENNFCKSCMDDWKKKSQNCPFKCNNAEIKPSRMVKCLLSKLKLSCPNKCGEEIPYEEYTLHCEVKCKLIDYKKKYDTLLKSFNDLQTNYQLLEKSNSDIVKDFRVYHYNSPSHPHVLARCITERNWRCNICHETHNSHISTNYCTLCDYDVCNSCKSKGK